MLLITWLVFPPAFFFMSKKFGFKTWERWILTIHSPSNLIPIFVLCLVGALLRKFGKVNDSFTEVADWIVFNIALPVMIFLEVASCSISEALDVSLIVFLVISVTACFLAVSLLSIAFIKDKSKRGAFIQGSCRSNFAVLGVPLAANMFGDMGRQAIAFAMPFCAFAHASYFTLRSGGQTLVTFLFDSCFMWAVCVPLAWVFSRIVPIGILPLYMLCQGTDLIKCVLGWLMVRKGGWIQNLTQ